MSIIHSDFFVGATIAVTNKTLFDRAFWDFFRETKTTNFNGVPYHYEMLKKLRFTEMQFPSLRTMTHAGGRMDPDLKMEFASHCNLRGMQFFTMYGQTEATARMSYLPSSRAVFKPDSIGIVILGGQFSLIDECGQLIKAYRCCY